VAQRTERDRRRRPALLGQPPPKKSIPQRRRSNWKLLPGENVCLRVAAPEFDDEGTHRKINGVVSRSRYHQCSNLKSAVQNRRCRKSKVGVAFRDTFDATTVSLHLDSEIRRIEGPNLALQRSLGATGSSPRGEARCR